MWQFDAVLQHPAVITTLPEPGRRRCGKHTPLWREMQMPAQELTAGRPTAWSPYTPPVAKNPKKWPHPECRWSLVSEVSRWHPGPSWPGREWHDEERRQGDVKPGTIKAVKLRLAFDTFMQFWTYSPARRRSWHGSTSSSWHRDRFCTWLLALRWTSVALTRTKRQSNL